MAKLKMPSDAAKALTVPERLLLLCVASAIDFKHAKIVDSFAGHAVYLGPTLYARLGANVWLSAAWIVQVWGAATGIPGALDLANFERHQAKLRLGMEF